MTSPAGPSNMTSPAGPGAPQKGLLGHLSQEFTRYLDILWRRNFTNPTNTVIDIGNQLNKSPPTGLKGHVILVCKVETWIVKSNECKEFLEKMFTMNKNLKSAKVIVISLPRYKENGLVETFGWDSQQQTFTKIALNQLRAGHLPAAIHLPVPGSKSTTFLVRHDILHNFSDLQDFELENINPRLRERPIALYVRLTPKNMTEFHDLKSPDDYLMDIIARNLQKTIKIVTDDKKLKDGVPMKSIVEDLINMVLQSADIYEMDMDRNTTTFIFKKDEAIQSNLQVVVPIKKEPHVRTLTFP
jgi:hypothetical protein